MSSSKTRLRIQFAAALSCGTGTQGTGALGNYGSATLRGDLGESFQNAIRLLNRRSNKRPFTVEWPQSVRRLSNARA